MNSYSFYNFYYRSFILGAEYSMNRLPQTYKFIKVTQKGFNLLDLSTNRCVFRHHLYSRDWRFIDIPEPIYVVGNVRVNAICQFSELKGVNR